MSEQGGESGFVVWVMRAFGTVLIVAVITLLVAHFNNINSSITSLRTDFTTADTAIRTTIDQLKDRDIGLGPVRDKLEALQKDCDAIKIELKSLSESQPKQIESIQLLRERLSVLEGKISKVKLQVEEGRR